MAELLENLSSFGRELRAAGVPSGPARVLTFCEAASTLPPSELYWVGRATLLWRPEQIPVYDEVFRRHFGRETKPRDDPEEQLAEVELPAPRHDPDADEGASGAAEGTASAFELLREKSFGECSEDEWRELARLIARIPLLVPCRATRRYRPARSGRVAVRRTVRKAATSGGEPLELHRRARRVEPRPLLLLVDVSGSMEPYSRGLLLFAHALLRATDRTEVYAFSTRLTRLTDQLTVRGPDAALAATAQATADWEGGTRIGGSMATLLRGAGASVRGAVVVVCSDGLEVDEPDALLGAMGRLSRLATRIIWLNPLKGDARYEPLARGMKAALPHVDRFVAGHNLASLEALARELAVASGSGRRAEHPVECAHA